MTVTSRIQIIEFGHFKIEPELRNVEYKYWRFELQSLDLKLKRQAINYIKGFGKWRDWKKETFS